MKKGKIDIEGEKLRQKSEELLKRNPKENAKSISESEALKLVHELEVHQIELELQNEELIKATKAAQIATEKYVELYDFALFGFFTLSKEGEILALNFNGAKMLGKNRSELVNRRLLLFISDDSKPIFNSFCETIISSKVKKSCEVEIQNNSSSPTHLHLSGIIKENEDQLFVMALDITSRKLAEIEQIKNKEKVEESEAKFRELFSNVNDAVFIYNPDTFEILEANEATSELYGYSYDELIGMSCLKFSAELEKSKSVAKLIKTESNVNVKLRHHKKKDGTDVFVELNTHNISVNGKNIIYSVCHDITDIKKTELELLKAKEKAEESEITFRKLFEDSSDPILLIDNTGVFVECNQAALNILKMTREQLLFQPPGIISPDYQLNGRKSEEAALEMINLAYKKGLHRFDWTHINAEGDEFIVAISLMPLQVKGQTMLHTTWRDITERKRAEEEIRLAKEKAEESEINQRMQNQEIELNNERLESLLKISQFHTDSIQELLDFALNEAINLTYSKIGYIYFYSEDTKQFSLNTWSKDVMKECNVMNPQTIYELDDTGCWGEAVRQRKPIVINDYKAENPLKKGTPHGHVKLSKFFTVPVIFDDKIVAVAGVANKATDYDDSDIRQLTLLMDNVWKISERIILIENLRKAKKETEESEQRLKLATNSGKLGIWDWNVKENIMVWDERMFQLYGIEKTAFVNTVDAWVNGLHPEDKDRAISESNEALAGGKQFDTTFRVLHPNGTVKYLKADAVVIRDNSEKAIRMIGINKDVTESILAEQSLKISETQLKELNATKDKLFSIIGHDLRSPFNSILGFSELLSEKVKELDIEEPKKYSEIINSTAKNSLNLLDNLLNWAKSQTDKLSIKPEKIILSKAIREVISLDDLLAKTKNISLNYTTSYEFEVYSDKNMLKLVLRNIITNAIKFTKTGGDINISVISAQNHVEISVSDNGVGMSDETSKKLFDIATNTTSPGTANEKGSGLGLVLCKEFVEKLGGNIWVESEEGVGSQFYFTIPLERNNKPIDKDRLSETI